MISHDYLKSLIRYEPNTGEFTHFTLKVNKAGEYYITERTDKPISFKGGSIRVAVGDMKLPARKVAYFYMTGRWPELNDVIHINGSITDLRWENLKLDGPFKYGDVVLDKDSNKWTAFTLVEDNRTHLGMFYTKDAAKAVLDESLLRLGIQ